MRLLQWILLKDGWSFHFLCSKSISVRKTNANMKNVVHLMCQDKLIDSYKSGKIQTFETKGANSDKWYDWKYNCLWFSNNNDLFIAKIDQV